MIAEESFEGIAFYFYTTMGVREMKIITFLLLMIVWAFFFTDHFILFWGKFLATFVDIIGGIVDVYKASRAGSGQLA